MSNENIDLSWYLYTAEMGARYTQKYGIPADRKKCRYSIFQDFWHSQCNRYPKLDIQGYGFCKQHARLIANRKDLDYDTLGEHK